MMRRDHPIDEDERPEAPSTGPLPRRAIPGGPAGALKPKALFLDGGEGDSEGEEGELTFKKEKGILRGNGGCEKKGEEKRGKGKRIGEEKRGRGKGEGGRGKGEGGREF